MADFDRIAGSYRWLEYLTFGRSLERCRKLRLPRMSQAKRALVLGDGDGRFTAALLAHNRKVQVVAVDRSAAMLRLLSARVQAAGASSRLRTIHGDAVALFQPASDADWSRLDPQASGDEPGSFDLVCSHFFLDCLSTLQVELLARAVTQHLAPHALWIVSEFATPSWWSRWLVAILYVGFAMLTGLRTRQLPLWREALQQNGFTCVADSASLAGLLCSTVWVAPKRPESNPQRTPSPIPTPRDEP